MARTGHMPSSIRRAESQGKAALVRPGFRIRQMHDTPQKLARLRPGNRKHAPFNRFVPDIDP